MRGLPRGQSASEWDDVRARWVFRSCLCRCAWPKGVRVYGVTPEGKRIRARVSWRAVLPLIVERTWRFLGAEDPWERREFLRWRNLRPEELKGRVQAFVCFSFPEAEGGLKIRAIELRWRGEVVSEVDFGGTEMDEGSIWIYRIAITC